MSDIRFNGFVGEHLDDAVVVTAIPSSGTTIHGKLFGSSAGIEYAFEPPLVAYLDAMCGQGQIDPETTAELLEVYLYYEYFAEYLHRRG